MNPWEDVKSRLSIQDVISEYVPIKRAGANYKCVCPFHNEKTPSLVISPDKQIWHCFGCGVGGDVFGWVSDIEHITRGEALRKMAKKAGVTLEPLKELTPAEKIHIKEQKSRQEKGYELLDWAVNLYHSILKKGLQDSSSPLTIYCHERKLSQETINTFQIGYAPKSGLIGALAQKHGLDLALLKEVGLLKEDGRDRFSDRFMIPILNQDKKVVGFTGRVLPYDTFDRPKYLNSPQSDWFDKRSLLFGLAYAQHTIRIEKYAILVEGNMDVVSMHSAGVRVVVASQGTAVTTEQLTLLKRYTNTIYLALDNDEAGKIAARKTYYAALMAGFEVKSVVIPTDYKDIDEWRLSGTIPTTLPVKDLLDVYLDRIASDWAFATKEEQRERLLEFIKLLKPRDTLVQDQYIQLVSKATSFSKDAIAKQLSSIKEISSVTNTAEQAITLPVSEKDRSRPVLVSFHTILAHSPENLSAEMLSILYQLLQPFFKEQLLGEYLEWSVVHEQELSVIRQNTRYDESLIDKINSFIDAHFARYQLDNTLMDTYFTWKREYQKITK